MSRTIEISTQDGEVVCERCLHASTAPLRLRGLLGRPEPAPGEGVLIEPAGSIHMCFMSYAIDAVFLDRADVVLDVREAVRPWRFAGVRGARKVLELRAGQARARGLRPGVRLVTRPAS